MPKCVWVWRMSWSTYIAVAPNAHGELVGCHNDCTYLTRSTDYYLRTMYYCKRCHVWLKSPATEVSIPALRDSKCLNFKGDTNEQDQTY